MQRALLSNQGNWGRGWQGDNSRRRGGRERRVQGAAYHPGQTNSERDKPDPIPVFVPVTGSDSFWNRSVTQSERAFKNSRLRKKKKKKTTATENQAGVHPFLCLWNSNCIDFQWCDSKQKSCWILCQVWKGFQLVLVCCSYNPAVHCSLINVVVLFF